MAYRLMKLQLLIIHHMTKHISLQKQANTL